MTQAVCPGCANPADEDHKFCPLCGFPLAEIPRTTSDELIGATLPGGYVILELVGVGGMGRVYRAEQKMLSRTVAVKIIHPHLLGDEQSASRFITEARAASRLNHPNSVAVIDFGKDGAQLYLVMEFLRGKDLSRIAHEEGPLPFRRIINVMVQVLAALGEAHHHGIIHRDLKPENIVLEPTRSGADFVKVVDFGLAKMRESKISNITNPGIVCGTPDYMSPEQGRGDSIDARSDLYACGVILFQLLTERLPYVSDSPTQVVLMHMTKPVPNPNEVAPDRDIPDELVEITHKALQKDPNHRYASAEEFADALRVALGALDRPSSLRFSLSDLGRYSIPELGIVCATCHSLVPRAQKFCGECGTRLANSSANPPSPSSIPVSERLPFIQDSSSRAGTFRLPLPLLEREDDMDWLQACRFEVDTTPVIARIVGAHGVGKTRLFREFIALEASTGDLIVSVTPDPWSAQVGYYALRKAIVQLAGLPADGGDPSYWASVSAEEKQGLSEVFGRNIRSHSLRPHLWTIPPHGELTPAHRRHLASMAFRWALQRANESANEQPVIVIFDDLHGIDGASRNAIRDVLRRPPALPILFLGAHIPGFDSEWPGDVHNIEGLRREIVASVLMNVSQGSIPPGLQRQKKIVPFHLEQLVRFYVEGGSNAPERLADLLSQRIERLPFEARRVLQAVAVIGDATDLNALQRVLSDSSSTELELQTLIKAGMIEPLNDNYRTSHPLLREVILASIPAAVKRDLYAKCSVNDTLALEVLAQHAYFAENSFEALMMLEQVADRAASRGDTESSIQALKRGLELARRELVRGELDDPLHAVLIFSRKLGEELARAGALIDANGILREALDLAGPRGSERAIVLGALAYVAKERARSDEANRYLFEALELARTNSESNLIASLEKIQQEIAQPQEPFYLHPHHF